MGGCKKFWHTEWNEKYSKADEIENPNYSFHYDPEIPGNFGMSLKSDSETYLKNQSPRVEESKVIVILKF